MTGLLIGCRESEVRRQSLTEMKPFSFEHTGNACQTSAANVLIA